MALFSCLQYTRLPIFYPSFTSNVLEEKTITKIPSAQKPNLKLYGKYICLIDSATGRVLYERQSEQPAPMASTTKIMTCLLALEKKTDGQEVTISAKASAMPKVHLGVKKGERYLLDDLLYSLMLTSHNDSAVAIAETIGGSVEGFADLMNARAAEIGMSKTHFVTPNGLDAESHISTSYDMCLLARTALQNPHFCEIIKTPSHSFCEQNSKRKLAVANKDAFLSIYEGALGVKTGFTSKAGFCFVGAAKRNEITLISTTLASGWPPNKSYKWSDTKTLMDYGFSSYKLQELPTISLSSLKIPVTEGRIPYTGCVDIDPPQMLLSDYDLVECTYQIPDSIEAPIDSSKPIGTVVYRVNATEICQIPVYPTANISKRTFSTYLFDILTKFSFS